MTCHSVFLPFFHHFIFTPINHYFLPSLFLPSVSVCLLQTQAVTIFSPWQVAARPRPQSEHPAGGNRGDEGLEDNPRYGWDPPLENSYILSFIYSYILYQGLTWSTINFIPLENKRFHLPLQNLQAIGAHVLSAVIVHVRKHVSKCTEGREEES